MADRVDVADLAVNFVSTGETGVQSSLQGIATHLLGLAGPAGIAAGAVIAATVGIAGASVKMAADFQESMTQLVTGAGESKANLGLVSQGILSLARDTGESTSQLAAGMYMIESAGYHGAAGLDILKASAEGAKVGNADLGTVADATTTILKDYPGVVNGASGAVNTLIATVANGKTHMQDLAQALAMVLPTASAAGVGLNDVMGAMATMTGEGVPAANAATYLRQTLIALEAPSTAAKKALASVGLSSAQVATDIKTKGLPATLQEITDAVGKKFPVGSAAYVQAIKDISGGSKTMQGMLDLTGQHMATFQQNVANVAGAVKEGGKSITGWTEVQGDFNQMLARGREVVETMMISLGTRLLPVLTQIGNYIVNNAMPAVSGLLTFMETHQAVVKTLALVVGGALVGALVAASVAAWGLAAGVIAATWPLLAIGAAIGLLVAGLIWAYQNVGPFRDAVNSIVQVAKNVITWIGQMIGDIKVLGNVFGDVAALIRDVVTGQWGKLKGDVEKIQRDWNTDMKTLADQQAANAKKTAQQEAADAVKAENEKQLKLYQTQLAGAQQREKQDQDTANYLLNLAKQSNNAQQRANLTAEAQQYQQRAAADQQAVGQAQSMVDQYNRVLGTGAQQAVATTQKQSAQMLSSMQDMTYKSSAQAAQLRGHVDAEFNTMSANVSLSAQQMKNNVLAQFQDVAVGGFRWGSDAGQSFAAGLMSSNGAVGAAAARLAVNVSNQLGHSTPKEGPMKGDDQWFYHLAENLASGLERGRGLVAQAAVGVAGAAAGALGGGTGTLTVQGGALGPLAGGGAGAAGGTGQTVVQINLDGRQLAQGIVPHLPRTFAIATGYRGA